MFVAHITQTNSITLPLFYSPPPPPLHKTTKRKVRAKIFSFFLRIHLKFNCCCRLYVNVVVDNTRVVSFVLARFWDCFQSAPLSRGFSKRDGSGEGIDWPTASKAFVLQVKRSTFIGLRFRMN